MRARWPTSRIRRDPAARRRSGEQPPVERARAQDATEDVERYTCSCGYVWEAPVTASVTCPHCGAAQAW